MLIIRLSKVAFVAAIALFSTLVAIGNIAYPSVNLAFVHHVFQMDTIFVDAPIKTRAISDNVLQHVGYWAIVTCETLTAILCWLGAIIMLINLKQPIGVFHRSKRTAIAGLSLGFLIWQVAFMSIGGEWFGMWMSKEWNGVPDAFRFFITILIVLIYVVIPSTDNETV